MTYIIKFSKPPYVVVIANMVMLAMLIYVITAWYPGLSGWNSALNILIISLATIVVIIGIGVIIKTKRKNADPTTSPYKFCVACKSWNLDNNQCSLDIREKKSKKCPSFEFKDEYKGVLELC